MRVKPSGEEGMSAVVTAICLVVLMSALVLTVDAGNLWQTRRNLITATDAAALQQARIAAIEGPGAACDATWIDILARNAGDVQPVSCRVEPDIVGSGGYVVVEARKAAAARFAPAIGLGQSEAYSMSSARYGLITQASGLRPIGVCLFNDHIQGFLGTGVDNGFDPEPGVHRVMYNKEQPDACGDAPGNWGFIDLDGGANSNTDLNDWIENGYDGETGVGDCDASDPPGDYCEGDPGATGCSVCGALQHLVDDQVEFSILIFDNGTTDGGGNASYNVYGFLGVRLVGFRMAGSQAQRYLDLEFREMTVTGNCCVPVAPDTGVYGLRLCTIDHDSQPDLTRCGLV